jgi:hypothetical protein
MYVCTGIMKCICVCVCARACMYVRTYVRMHVCMLTYIIKEEVNCNSVWNKSVYFKETTAV